MMLCLSNEKQDKGNLVQKGLPDNAKADSGATEDHSCQWVVNVSCDKTLCITSSKESSDIMTQCVTTFGFGQADIITSHIFRPHRD